jgi:hypothetical protein
MVRRFRNYLIRALLYAGRPNWDLLKQRTHPEISKRPDTSTSSSSMLAVDADLDLVIGWPLAVPSANDRTIGYIAVLGRTPTAASLCHERSTMSGYVSR